MINLLWFILIFLSVAILLFVAMLLVIKMNQRRKIDPVYDAKVTRIVDKVDPYYNFFYNLFGWIFALLVIYYIYLG